MISYFLKTQGQMQTDDHCLIGFSGRLLYVAFCPACGHQSVSRLMSTGHDSVTIWLLYGLLRIEHTTHAIQPSGEMMITIHPSGETTRSKPSVQLS